MLYCCKDYKNVTKDKKFLQSRFFVCFSDSESSLLKYMKLFQGGFFYIWRLESYILKCKRNIRLNLGAREFHFQKFPFPRQIFLFFFEVGLKSVPGICILYYSFPIVYGLTKFINQFIIFR